MTRQLIGSTIAVGFLFAAIPFVASAATVFYDDFSDGSVTNDTPLDRDGTPVKWTERPNQNGYDATSGDYVLTATTDRDQMFSAVVDEMFTDVSIRFQVRNSSVDGGAVVAARLQDSLALPSTGAYFGGIANNPNRGGTNLFLGRSNEGGLTFLGISPPLPFDVTTEDAVLQLDVIGNELKLWGWKAGDPMPDQPQLTATDNTYSAGTMRIFNDAVNSNIATFRYVHVADSHITADVPEPNTLLIAMFGMAGLCCCRRRR